MAMRPYAPSGFTRRVLPVGARRRLAPTSPMPTRTLSTDWRPFSLPCFAHHPFSILSDMRWIVGALILAAVGFLLRRLLGTQLPEQRLPAGLPPLGSDRRAVYDGFAPEVEARIAMLGISLNDAFEERDAGRHDMAWRMVRLSASEWDGMEKIVAGLLNALTKHLENAQVVVASRSIHAHRFKSRTMVDYVRMHELVDQLVFSSRRRYQLQLRLLRRAAEIVTGEFRYTYRHVEKTGDKSPQVWSQIDLSFHDFDLIAKEAVLAFRALLACLPPSALPRLSFDLNALLRGRVRARSLPVQR